MTTRLYYLMAYLPDLPRLGEPPPITVEEVLRLIGQERPEDVRILGEAFGFESLLNKTAQVRLLGYSAGDTAGAFSLDPGLPPFLLDTFLKDPQDVGEDAWLTELWSKHLDFMEGIGKDIGSPLLSRWAQWERSLRQQLARIRRQSEPESQIEEGPVGQWDHSALLAEWRAVRDPLAGERLLDEARMKFIDEESRHYSFTIDELVAYFLKLGLLSRHARLSRDEGVKVLEEVTTL
jgi:hypothetical protein